VKPTLDEVTAYCLERKNLVDPQRWLDHYESNGWRVGKNPMRDWRAAVRTWEKNDFDRNVNPTTEKQVQQIRSNVANFLERTTPHD
jgi:hypothetical protein